MPTRLTDAEYMARQEAVERLYLESTALQRALKARFHTMLGSEGLSMSQMMILFYVAYNHPATNSRIARHTLSSRSSVAQQLDWLTKKQYIRRHIDPLDQRVSHAILTPTGSQKVKAIEARRKGFFMEITGSLLAEDIEAMTSVQRKMLQQIQLLQDAEGTGGKS